MSDPFPGSNGTVSQVLVAGLGSLSFISEPQRNPVFASSIDRHREHEPFQSLLFRMAVSNSSVVCDFGAAEGWYTVQAARLGASVVAIETDPDAGSSLQRNLQANGCAGVQVVHYSAQDQPFSGPIFRDRMVDVLRLSADGREAEVLKLLAPAITDLRRAFVRVAPARLAARGSSATALFEQFRKLQLSVFEIDSTAERLRPLTFDQLAERVRSGRFSALGGEHLDIALLHSSSVPTFLHLIEAYPEGRVLADGIHPDERRRVELTVSCRDTDRIPKVPGAGSVQRFRDQNVQIMHNGVRVAEGCYYGDWTTEIISRLHGHHEPQEEVVFHEIMQRLAAEAAASLDLTNNHIIVELGAFWSYYALWFLAAVPGGRAVLVEPDPSHLAVAAANLRLNDREALLIQAAVGPTSVPFGFTCEDGTVVKVPALSLTDLLEAAGAERAAVVLCDVQGAETLLLESSITTLARQTRFLVLSTHHETISGRADTHEYCLSILRQWGAHIIAEHRIDESFSGDGLIAVSFDECDRDLNVEVSVCRRADSLFGEVNVQELRDHAAGLAVALEKANVFAASLEAHSSALQDSLQAAEEYAESLRASFAEAEEYALDLRRTLDDLSA